ncbi:response regulator [Desulfobacterales bacterium HSG17]|nr:response regulator [Desulfobacterales bacterium HSG17]
MAEKLWKILVVDDEPNNLSFLRQILMETYDLAFAPSGIKALEIIEKVNPDLVLLDIMMPKMDGYETCRRLKANPQTAKIPVIFVTAMSEVDDESYGFDVGCVDYITKPLSPPIVHARVGTHLTLFDQQLACEKLVAQRTKQLESSHSAAIHMLGEAGHYNDTDTGVHIWRMADYSAAIARCYGWHVEKTHFLELAAPMHDTGKIGIPDSILKKPGKLDTSEWQRMRTHSYIGYKILKKSDSPIFTMAAEVTYFHHEKWDGTGYPRQLKADQIPESARIVAIADVFDALTMKRPYKEEWPFDEAFSEIRNSAGTHFDPTLVDCFCSIKDEITGIKEKWTENETDFTSATSI